MLPVSTVADVAELTKLVEERFSCTTGPAKAFFEVDGPDGVPTRQIYQVMSFGVRVEDGATEEMLCSFAWDNVFEKLLLSGARRIVWRRHMDYSVAHSCDARADLAVIRGRFVAQGKDGEQIDIHTWALSEDGLPRRVLEKPELEDGVIEVPRLPEPPIFGFNLQLDSQEANALRKEFGYRNFDATVAFLTHVYDSKGLRIQIDPTWEDIRDILEIVHGRPGVGEVRLHIPSITGMAGEAA